MQLVTALKLPLTKALLKLGLLLAFIYQVYISLCKLEGGQLGTRISHESYPNQTLPTFSFCQVETPVATNLSLAEQFEVIKDWRTVHRVMIPEETSAIGFLNSLRR